MTEDTIVPSDDRAGTEDIPAIYDRLAVDRQEYLDRARDNALLTVPALMPPEGHAPGSKLHTPAQSIGSHGINTLANKIVMTLLPANAPIFRYSVSDTVVEAFAEDTQARAGVEKKLNEIERSAMDEIEGLGIRANLVDTTKQLLIAGNALLYFPKTGPLKVYRLDRYVVQRDFEGNFLRAIIKETVALETLPVAIRLLIVSSGNLPSDDITRETSKNEVDVYTVFERKDGFIITYQWCKGIQLPRSQGRWPVEKTPVMALRWNATLGEDYGRAYVDDYVGDLTAVENLSLNIREGIAAMTKINPMVNPTGLTKAKDVAKAKNLEIIIGRRDDVTMLQFEKQADLKFAGEYIQSIIQRLMQAFMLNQSAQRSGERVTAEEIRRMISDIDDNMGGVYSLLANDLQRPFVIRLLYRMEQEKKIPKLSDIKGPDGKPIAQPKIVTGVEALGRGHDFNKYLTYYREILAPLKEIAFQEVNMRDFLERTAISLNIDIDGLLKSEDQKATEAQQRQTMQQQALMQEVVKGATPGVSKAVADGVVNSMQDTGAVDGE